MAYSRIRFEIQNSATMTLVQFDALRSCSTRTTASRVMRKTSLISLAITNWDVTGYAIASVRQDRIIQTMASQVMRWLLQDSLC